MPDAADSYGFSVALLVKEKPEALLSKLEPGETSLYPRILFSGQTAEKSGAVTVHFEELQLTTMDIVDGFALLLAVYWTFNIQYAPKTKRTCLLFEMMLGLPPTEQMVSVIKAATAIQVERRV
ncbi:uncharacterized protein LOC144180471 [Haemaphysalis longicornis]